MTIISMSKLTIVLSCLYVLTQLSFSQDDIEKMNKLEYVTSYSSQAESYNTEVLFMHESNSQLNPVINIQFLISMPGYVKLGVYDMLGKEIAVLISEEMKAGDYNVDFDGSGLSSGIYFCRINAGEFSEIKKMALVK